MKFDLILGNVTHDQYFEHGKEIAERKNGNIKTTKHEIPLYFVATCVSKMSDESRRFVIPAETSY